MIPTGNRKVAGEMEAWITLEGMNAFVNDVRSGMKKARTHINAIGKDLRKVGLVLGGIGVAATKMAADVSTGMAEIGTLSEYTNDQLNEIEAGIKRVGLATGQHFKSLKTARYDIISSGFKNIAQSEEIMAQASKAAVVGITDVTNTAKVGTKILDNYKMEASEIGYVYDVVFNIIREGVTTMEELAPVIGQVVPFAKAANLQLKDMGAMIANITGALSTPRAITAAVAALRALSDKTIIKNLHDAGMEVKRLSDGSLDLLGTVQQFAGMDLETIRRFIPETEAATGILIMANNFEKLQNQMRSFDNVSGLYIKKWNERADDFDVKWGKLIEKLKYILIDLGKEILPEVEKGIGNISERMDEWLPTFKEFFRMVGDVVSWVVKHGDLISKLFVAAVLIKTADLLYRVGKNIYYLIGALKALGAASLANPVTGALAVIALGIIGISKAINQVKTSIDRLDPSQLDEVFYVPPGKMKYDEWYEQNKERLEGLKEYIKDEDEFLERIKTFYRLYLKDKEWFIEQDNGLQIEFEEPGTPKPKKKKPLDTAAIKEQSLESLAAAREFYTSLAALQAESEEERLKIQMNGIEHQLLLLDKSDEDYLKKKRALILKLAETEKQITDIQGQELERQKQQQIEYINYIENAIMQISRVIGLAMVDARRGIKDVFKSILITVVEAIERFAVLAELQDAIQMHFKGGVLNPAAWLDFLANQKHLLAALAALETVKGSIMAMATGGVLREPTLTLLAERVPEIVAPEKDFWEYVSSRGGENEETLKEIRGLRGDVNDLNRTMKKFRMETKISDKEVMKVFKHADSREKRNKL